MDEQIKQHEERIIRLQSKVEKLSELDAEFATLRTQNVELQKELDQSHIKIKEMDKEIVNRGEWGMRLQREIDEKNPYIVKLQIENQKMVADLEEIRNSHGWRFITKYYKLRNFILSLNSRRRRIVQVIWQFLWKPVTLKRLNMTTIKETTQKQGTCIGCGLCAVACPEDCISMHWSKKQKWVPQIDASKCTRCNLCAKVCPNTSQMICEYAIDAAKEGERFGLQSDAQYFISYDLNSENRIRSASGGAVNTTLQYLLQTGKIDGAIVSVSVMAPIGSPHYELKIVRSIEELDKARSSHYYPLTYDKVFREACKDGGHYVIMGTPCIIRGIKNLPKKIRDRIRYTFCLVCSHNVTGQFLDCLAKQEGVIEGEPFISDMRDKFGGIPDASNYNNYFKLSSREIRRNRFQTAFTDMWRNYFFAFESCLYCPDFYGVDADLSTKDYDWEGGS